jgi:hypothetical protein
MHAPRRYQARSYTMDAGTLDLERCPDSDIPNDGSDVASSYHTAYELHVRDSASSLPTSLRERAVSGRDIYSRPQTLPDASLGSASDTPVPPPFVVAVTGHCLSCTALLIGLGIPKTVSVARGKSAANTLDWAVSVIAALL